MPPKRVKREKGTRASTARRESEEEDIEMQDEREPREREEEEDQDDEAAKLERVLASIANYPDQPIEPIQQDKIRVLGSEVRVQDQVYSQALEAMVDTAVMLADALPSEEDPFENEDVLKIKASLLELLDLQHISALHLEALDNDVRKPIGNDVKIIDPASVFKEGLDKRIESYKSQTARQRYGKSKVFKKFVEGVWETRQSEAMPPITQFLPREGGDPEDSDDDMEIGGVTQDYKCPITLQIYTNPLTSTTCGHTFSAEAIKQYIKKNNKCPGTGCDAKISLGVLKLDRNIQKKAIAAQRRAEKDKAPTDSESDIEVE